MPSPATTWLHVSGYRFLLRRIECALLFGDVCAATGALRARTTSLALGCVLAIVAAMGCAFVALLRPQSALGQAPIVMGRESGALYVRVDDVWHPVLNLASARLIAATNANPQPVSESELGHTKRGPLLGIPGAPQLLDQPLAGAESAWAICDSDNGGSTTVVVGPAEDSSAQVLTAEQMILVATESGSPTYLLYGGRRAVVRSPFTSLAEVGAVHYPWLPLRRLLLDHYPSIERIASVHAPVLVIAGGSDDIVPATLSERLVAAAAEPKRYVVVPGVGHNDPELLDGRVMLDAIRRFLTETAVLGQ